MNFIDLKKQYQTYQKDINREINEVLNSAGFILGEKVKKIEELLKQFVNVDYAIGVSSGTDALLISLMAIGIKPGDEVITTPFTFIATAEVIRLLGAKPVFVDIDPEDYNIDVALIESLITEKTKAIMPVSLYGQCADMQAINALADKFQLKVIEDACQSFGATTSYGRSCGISDIGCTSFFPSKPFGCYGDGGMIFTNDEDLAQNMMEIRVHGQNKRYNHRVLGINGRLDAIQAAVLIAKFPFFAEELARREEIGQYYKESLSTLSNSNVILPSKNEKNINHVYAQFSIQVDKRDHLAKYLNMRGIPTAVHYPIPLHLQPVFADLGYNEGDFLVAEKISKRIISLPMHPFLTKEDQDLIVSEIKQGVES